jgi:hypothetical protein
MDHSNAHLMEFTTEPLTTMIISSRFTRREKQQHEPAAYYKKIGEAIINYQDVLLFGPTSAKTELYNMLKADHHFEKIRIETKEADKMTQNEQHAFVREHFSSLSARAHS